MPVLASAQVAFRNANPETPARTASGKTGASRSMGFGQRADTRQFVRSARGADAYFEDAKGGRS